MLKKFSPPWPAWLIFTCMLSGCGASSAVNTFEPSSNPIIPPQGGNSNPVYSAPKQIGLITDPQLTEISGLAASRTTKGVWWVHNDSGDKARLYAINNQGRLLAKYSVSEARNIDWEDLASGPGSDGKPALYIGDIGNNSLSRSELTIYRVSEPSLAQASPKTILTGETAAAEAFPFRYPDGKHDAEAIFVDPQSGRLYIVTKKMTLPCAVYRLPLPLQAGKTVTLEKVSGAAVKTISELALVTGATASPDGQRVVIRTYFTAIELTRAGRGFESVFNAEPLRIKIPLERQGEAISYTADGKALVTTSEHVPAPLFQLVRLGK
jgi:hypothetical protein